MVETRPPPKCVGYIHGKSRRTCPDKVASNMLVFCGFYLTEHISRIPKELISRFVKICPTCQVRRRGSRLTPPSSRRESPQLEPASRSPTDISPPVSRRQSVVSRHANLDRLQTHVLSESRSQGDWDNGRQQIREQPGESHGMSSFLSDALHTMPNSIASPLNPPRSDPSLIPPQLRYNPVLVRNDGNPNQRSF